ncbi:MAG: bifunctional diaminohydroxyphosphoribosylaminopyrimidine deaminase/5-amino-6-(5-phosphoribosylamino)uracil reductase RibD [Bdellovibrionales bacterium]|nr:bifunctional diaminohydroxyphosphoribosylaminopyrimidine deaminase/5-amino-6-(5-phosphoribosylamino)uracil reductase RibD [Bdellovibrionales bacterium]
MAKIGAIITIDEAMQLALAEAKKGAGFTSPNPLVGAVVLDKNNKLLSVDYHKNYGGPHAEVNALNKLNDRQLEGAKIIVTLEPCAHEGKTPSCAKKLATLPISTVIYAVEDPNPLVAGKGLEILKESGKEVIHLSHYENEAIELAEIFFTNQKLKRPFVSLKVASSLDGYIGLQSGESQWITGEKARNYGHFLRATHDAICVGAKTFIVDNPKLNIRHNDFPNKKNKVIVLDSEGNLSDKIKSSNLIKYHSLEDILIIHPEKIKNKPEQDLKLIPVKYSQGFDVEDLLDKLFEKNIFSLLIEGGAKTYQLFLESKKFDRLFCFIAPSLIGQKNGLSWTKDLVTRSLSEKLSFDKLKAIPLDPDILLTMKTSDNH